MSHGPFAGRSIPDSGFAADDGRAAAGLVAAVATFSDAPGSARTVLRALATGRVLIPVVALVEEVATGDDGRVQDKRSAMAAVMVEHEGGERSMLAFTSVASLAQWRSDARPVPVSGISAAQSALAQGATSLLIDVAGPTTFAVTGAELQALAGARLVGSGPVDDAKVRSAIVAISRSEFGLLDVRLPPALSGQDLVLVLDPTLSEQAYRSLLDHVTGRLAADPVVRGRFPDGLRVRIVAPGADLDDTPSLIHPPGSDLGQDSAHD